jgi:hypothetical protein
MVAAAATGAPIFVRLRPDALGADSYHCCLMKSLPVCAFYAARNRLAPRPVLFFGNYGRRRNVFWGTTRRPTAIADPKVSLLLPEGAAVQAQDQ